MRETRKSIQQSQPEPVNEKQLDALHEAVEQEYSKLYRHIYQTARKTARHILRHVLPPRAPRVLPSSDFVKEGDDPVRKIFVVITDGHNQRPHKSSAFAGVMPSVSSIRELISFVPTMKNLATRGHLTGIPYLGDKFDDDDQQIINSISDASSKHSKTMRKKKLDDPSLLLLYQTVRSSPAWTSFSNEQMIDAIIHCHRDSSSRAKLATFVDDVNRCQINIDSCESIDVDINDLVIKSWCSRFCFRCYTYNCLLHTGKSPHLPLPKQCSISYDNKIPPCSSGCYKHEREHLKRSLSPSQTNESDTNHFETFDSSPSDCIESVKKRRRQSTSSSRLSSTNKTNSRNENVRNDLSVEDYRPPLLDSPKTFTSHFLTRIENRMKNHLHTPVNHSSEPVALANQWTLTDRSLFRLFYFLFDGDLCSIKQLFHDHRTCQDMYEQFILDAKYFSDQLSMTEGLPLIIRQPYRRRMIEGGTRAFLFHIKKNFGHRKKSEGTLKPAYQPCLHEGPCTLSNPDCHCMQTGAFCEKFCHCPMDCPHRFPGCTCKGACLLNNCLCCAEGRECDPDLCHKCGASLLLDSNTETQPPLKSDSELSEDRTERKTLPPSTKPPVRVKSQKDQRAMRQHSRRSCRDVESSQTSVRQPTKRTYSRVSWHSHPPAKVPVITCANISLQRRSYKQILIAESDVAGYGAFLGSSIAYPGDLIAEYTGEIISEEEADRRGRLYDKQACSYLFNLDANRCVDARQFGGKIRFANHSSKPNCVPKVKLVNGDYRIGIYAKQVIFAGEELFFEYMYDAHQRQQFVNNERVDQAEQDGLTILKRYGDNLQLVRSSYD